MHDFQKKYSLYEHHATSHITLTSISSEIQKLPKYHIFVDESIHPSIDCVTNVLHYQVNVHRWRL